MESENHTGTKQKLKMNTDVLQMPVTVTYR